MTDFDTIFRDLSPSSRSISYKGLNGRSMSNDLDHSFLSSLLILDSRVI